MHAMMNKKHSAIEVFGLVVVMSLSAFPALGDSSAAAANAQADSLEGGRRIDPYTWVDHDGHPVVPEPKERKLNLYSYYYREALVEPIARLFDIPGKILRLLDALGVAESEYEAVNLNAFDEVANSMWFTNRNHMKAVSLDEIRRGPENHLRPETPWRITSVKKEGVVPGFQIKDAAGKKWVIKLDPPGYPQIASGADVVVTRLLIASGYSLPHDVALTFRREDLTIDEELAQGKDGDEPFTDNDLTKLLERGHREADGRQYCLGSFFLSGTPIGPIDFRERRKDDPNDWYTHRRRRELRGLYVIASWLNHWDSKDQQSLDMFEEKADSLGTVRHHLLDMASTLGGAAEGPKALKKGYEQAVDFGWIGRRIVTFGFLVEPWRRAKQETGIPSVGNFESAEFDPGDFRSMLSNPAFRERLDGDGYWGAKIVASFSNDQIQAAIDAAGYEDPRARDYLLKTLIERRDKIMRYWFGRVAPLDFFHIKDGALNFRDLAVDVGLEPSREYEVQVEAPDGAGVAQDGVRLNGPNLPLATLGAEGRHVRLRLSPVGSRAKATTVELMKKDEQWLVARVRHG